MPRAFSEHERELIAKRLLEQGTRQFAAHGLKKTSIEELAAAAGISKGAFYSFHESKESLFMDAVEQVEGQLRAEVLAIADQPGPSPRARLFAMFKKAFTLWTTIPILRDVTRSDYELLFSRVPADKLQEHLANDRVFVEELVVRCRSAGIPIRAPAEEIDGLLHAVVLYCLHEDDLGPQGYPGTSDRLLELAAAFSLGEVHCDLATDANKDHRNEPGH